MRHARSTYLVLVLTTILISCNDPNSWECIEGDCMNGNGTKKWNDGGIEKGGWVNGEHNGKGYQYFGKTSEFAGDTYEGTFVDDKYEGFGTYYDSSSDGTYTGEWKDGEKHGNGKASWGEDSEYPHRYYEGEWRNGQTAYLILLCNRP